MEENALSLRYIYNNEVYENPLTIPPTADVICLFMQHDETVVFATSIKSGHLAAIECFDTWCDAREKATEIALLAEDTCTLTEDCEGTPIFVHRDPSDFDLGYELPENQILVVKEQFHYAPNERDRVPPVQEHAERFVGEILLLEPTNVMVKRAFFDANRNLLAFEYPFYEINEHQQSTESILFLEVTTMGEQWIRRCHSADSDNLEREALLRYPLPANQDSYLAPLAHHFAAERVFAIDADGNPMALEDASDHAVVRIVYCDEQNKPLNSRLMENQLFAEAEVYDVPIAHHDFVLHAMLRQLHGELKLLAPNTSPHASHYVKVMAPVSRESTEQIPLEPGQAKQHVSIYHLRGNLISHVCVIYDAEGTPIEERHLTSPTDFTECFRQPIRIHVDKAL